MDEIIFCKEDFEGEAVGGYFVRNDLKEFFDKLAEQGKRPVAIKFDGTYNLEIIVQDIVKEEPIKGVTQ